VLRLALNIPGRDARKEEEEGVMKERKEEKRGEEWMHP